LPKGAPGETKGGNQVRNFRPGKQQELFQVKVIGGGGGGKDKTKGGGGGCPGTLPSPIAPTLFGGAREYSFPIKGEAGDQVQTQRGAEISQEEGLDPRTTSPQ